MIFDRTPSDVFGAINIRRTKSPEEFTDQDIQKLQRGMVTLETINRISGKQIEIDEEISQMLYLNGSVGAKIWSEDDVFMSDNLQRMTDDTASLKSRFLVFSTTPVNPRPEYHYREFNLMEKILYDLGIMVQSVKDNYRECGNYECGA